MNINQIINKERVALYTKGYTELQQKTLAGFIVSKVNQIMQSKDNNPEGYAAYLEKLYEENISTIVKGAAYEVRNLLGLDMRDLGKGYGFFTSNGKCAVGLDKTSGFMKFWSEKCQKSFHYDVNVGLDAFIKQEKGWYMLETRVYLLNTYAGFNFENDIDCIADSICQSACKTLMNLQSKDFKIILNSDINYENMYLTGDTSVKKKVVKKQETKKVERKTFVDENFYKLKEEDIEVLEKYETTTPKLIKVLSDFGKDYEDVETKKEFCKNYGFLTSTINKLLYFSEKTNQQMFKEFGYDKFSPRCNNTLLYPVNTVNGTLCGYITRGNTTVEKYKHGMLRNYYPNKDCQAKGIKEETLQKRALVYGLDKVKEKVDKGEKIDKIIIVESIAKALVITQNFEELNVLSTMGAEVLDTQLVLIQSVVPKDTTIIMGYDNDKKGIESNISQSFKFLKVGYSNIKYLPKKQNYLGMKDENDLIVHIMKTENKNVQLANIKFMKIFKKMLSDLGTFQYPSIKQLDILTNAGYSLKNLVDLYTGTIIDLENENEVLKKIVEEKINKRQLIVKSIEELKEVYQTGGLKAIQMEVGFVIANGYTSKWDIVSLEQHKNRMIAKRKKELKEQGLTKEEIDECIEKEFNKEVKIEEEPSKEELDKDMEKLMEGIDPDNFGWEELFEEVKETKKVEEIESTKSIEKVEEVVEIKEVEESKEEVVDELFGFLNLGNMDKDKIIKVIELLNISTDKKIEIKLKYGIQLTEEELLSIF